jgi:hypothetical protein
MTAAGFRSRPLSTVTETKLRKQSYILEAPRNWYKYVFSTVASRLREFYKLILVDLLNGYSLSVMKIVQYHAGLLFSAL